MRSGNVTCGDEDCDTPQRSVTLHSTRRLSLKTRWAIWRARYSTVGLLARLDERKAVSLVATFNGGLAILAIGFLAWITDLPLMFPALGPTVFILFATPTTESAAPRSIIVGHFSGMASGWVVWHLVSTVAGGPVFPADRRLVAGLKRVASPCCNLRAVGPVVLPASSSVCEQFGRRIGCGNQLA